MTLTDAEVGAYGAVWLAPDLHTAAGWPAGATTAR
jgi:hypothetical protein